MSFSKPVLLGYDCVIRVKVPEKVAVYDFFEELTEDAE